MRILILGVDGYLGWPTALYLSDRGHDVVGIDNYLKRRIETQSEVSPLVPLFTMDRRRRVWWEHFEKEIAFRNLDISENELSQIGLTIEAEEPDVIIHYAEQPSAPYSMRGPETATLTQRNNVIGTLEVLWAMKHRPDIHLVKLGTMGEYGTPNIDIEEGWLDIEHKGRTDRVLYPKKPSSFYHASKCHDSTNIEMACRLWGLRATDLNQGVVYGIETSETALHPDLRTSFHYDAIFGTALNRFVTQAALGLPPTVYGRGGQTRGWLNILDTLQCVELACLNPAEPGEFRVFNQMTETFSVRQLAEKVASLRGLRIEHIDNPRVEAEEHYYHVEHTGLEELGLKPHLLTDDVLLHMMEEVERHADNVDRAQLQPGITWR